MTSNKKKYSTAVAYEERTRFQYLDIIISSGIIKRMFFERCQELEINPNSVAFSVGVSIHAFRTHYVNNPCPSATNTFPQEKFIKMLERVGIDIKVVVSQLSIEETLERQKTLKIYKRKVDE
jgi:hypothetical protein